MNPKPPTVATRPSGFVRWVQTTRALWKWLAFEELTFGFFIGSALGFCVAAAWFTLRA